MRRASATDLARADLKMKPAEFVLLWILTPFLFVAAAFIIGIIFPGFSNIVALVAFFLLASGRRATTSDTASGSG